MSSEDDASFQTIDGTKPTLVLVPIKAYYDLIYWTDRDVSEFQLAPQIIRDAANFPVRVVLREDDFLELKNSWQVSKDQQFRLVGGTKKGAEARALYFPDGNDILVLKRAKMADSEAAKDFDTYSEKRRELRADDGPVKRIDGEWIFTRNVRFDSPSTAASVLLGYRVGAFEGWEPGKP